MDNNRVFNRLLHLTGCGKDPLFTIEIFKLGGVNASVSKIKAWRTEQGSKATPLSDQVLNAFLDGLFKYRDQQLDKGISLFYTEKN